MHTEQEVKRKPNKKILITQTIGIALVAMSLVSLGIIFYPIIKTEIGYYFNKNSSQINPSTSDGRDTSGDTEENIIDKNFSIIITKLGINSKIIPDVDAENSREYQKKLAEGVAHAKGSSYPDANGDVFLFAHSGTNYDEALRFNAVFYLLNKLESGDEISVYYKGNKINYAVKEKAIVSSEEVRYNAESDEKRLILMTCWPPGTTWKRLIITAESSN